MSQANFDRDQRSTTGIPRWVKVSGVALIVLILLFVTLHLAGFHHPGLSSMSDMPSMQQATQQP